MKTYKKGLIISFLLIIIVLLIVGINFYFKNSKNSLKISSNTTVVSSSLSNNSITVSTTTSTGLPVTIHINVCSYISLAICFGSGAQPSTKVIKGITLWYKVSTNTLDAIGIQATDTKGIDTLYDVQIDFGNHNYTNKEAADMEDVVISFFYNSKR